MEKANPAPKRTKKQDLLQAAETLYLAEGIRSVTVEEISRHARVSKATFYKYFADKRDILEQVLVQIFATLEEQLQNILEKGKRDRLTHEEFINIFDMDGYQYIFLSDFVQELVQHYPKVTQKLPAMIDKIKPIFHDLIRLAKVDGIVRMDADTDVLILYSLVVKKSMQQALRENPQILEKMSVKEYINKVHDLYLNGIVAKK